MESGRNTNTSWNKRGFKIKNHSKLTQMWSLSFMLRIFSIGFTQIYDIIHVHSVKSSKLYKCEGWHIVTIAVKLSDSLNWFWLAQVWFPVLMHTVASLLTGGHILCSHVQHISSISLSHSPCHTVHTSKCFGASAIQPSVYRCGNPFV